MQALLFSLIVILGFEGFEKEEATTIAALSMRTLSALSSEDVVALRHLSHPEVDYGVPYSGTDAWAVATRDLSFVKVVASMRGEAENIVKRIMASKERYGVHFNLAGNVAVVNDTPRRVWRLKFVRTTLQHPWKLSAIFLKPTQYTQPIFIAQQPSARTMAASREHAIRSRKPKEPL